jgi:hypothetical protein
MKIFTLPIIFACLGFLFTTRNFIKTYDKLPPYLGLLFYYFIITITVICLEYMGLIINGVEFSGFKHTVGSILVIFSFFIIVDWESCYVNIVTKGNCGNISNVYFSSEDGAVYDLWNKVFPGKHNLNRVLTYVLTPFLLTLIGLSLLTENQKVTINI